MEDWFTVEPSVRYRIDSARQIVYLNYASNPGNSEWKRIIDQIFAHPDYKPFFNILSDRRNVPEGSPDLLESVIEHLAVSKVQGRWEGRWAVVLTNPPAFQQAKIIQNMLQPIDVVYRMFTEFEEAERWLLSSQPA